MTKARLEEIKKLCEEYREHSMPSAVAFKLALSVFELLAEIKELEAKNEKLRSDFESMQSMVFVGNCPTCKQAFQDNEEKESDFNLYKIKNLESIREEGQTVALAEALLAVSDPIEERGDES